MPIVSQGYVADVMEQRVSVGKKGKNASKNGGSRLERMSCKVCSPDCPNCTSGRSCGVEYNMQMLRGIPLAVQTFSITTCFFLGIVTFRVRRTRVNFMTGSPTLAVFECLFDSRADLNARVFTMSYEWLISHAGSGQELMPGEMKCTVF